MEEHRVELTEFQLAVRRIAATDDGKFLFEHLRNDIATRSAYSNGHEDGLRCALSTAWLNGQHDFVRSLLKIIDMEVE